MKRYLQSLSDQEAEGRKKIRLGIIGIGQIGKFHLNNYKDMPDVEIVAAADVNENELAAVAESYNIPNTYTDYRELIQRDDLDAVDICLHNNLHAPVTIDVLRSGKHAYCEKPIAGSYFDGKTMIDAAKECGKMLHIQMAKLFLKEARAAKMIIDKGEIGRIYHARASGHRRRGRPFVDGYGKPDFVKKEIAAGGALFDAGIYNIVQILYLMGMPEIQRVGGKVYQELDMDEERRKFSGYNVEEFGIGMIRFKGNVTMDIIQSWAVNLDSFESSYILGSKGGIRLNPFGYFYNLGDLEIDATANLDRMDTRLHDLRPNADAYDLSQHHWIAALQGRVPLIPTADIALQMMLIGEGIYMSDRLGREVTTEEIIEQSKSIAVSL